MASRQIGNVESESKISLTHDRKHAGNLNWETSFYSDWYVLSLYI